MANSRDHNNSSSGSGGGGDSVDLTCPVCYDTFRSPRFLPCHHSLCTECISDLMERAAPRQDFFLCPLCQVKVPVPEDGVTSFQVNFYLAPFLSGRLRIESGPQLSQDVTKTKKQSSPDSSPGSSFDLSCERHWSGEWTHFCRVCASLVCRPSCSQHQGRDHAVVDVTSEAPGHRSEVRRQLLSLTTLQGALANLEDECRHRVAALEQSCQQVVLKVEDTRQQACQIISARAERSKDKAQGLKGRISRVVEGERKMLQEKRGALSSLLTSANDVLGSGDAEFLRHKTKLMARIQSFMSKVPPSRGHLQFSFRMSPAIDVLLLKESGSSGSGSGASFGSMTVQFQSPVLRQRLELSSTKLHRKLHKLCPCRDGSVLASVGNCLVTITPDLVESKRLEFPGEVVDFLPSRNGQVYVALPFPHPVKRLDPTTDVAKDFVTPLSPPTAIACTDKRELVLASHDGKELSLTFYSEESSARLRRVTLPRPELSPVVALTTSSSIRQGRLFLCSVREVVCLDTDYSLMAVLEEEEGEGGGRGAGGGLRPRGLSGLRGIGSGVGDILMANEASGNVEIVELNGGRLTRKEELIQWKRGTSDEDADLTQGLIPKVSCAVLDQSGKLWVGQEDGHVSVYDWLLRTT